jgi:hypothetical protein
LGAATSNVALAARLPTVAIEGRAAGQRRRWRNGQGAEFGHEGNQGSGTAGADALDLPEPLVNLGNDQVMFSASMVDARKGGADRTRAKNAAKQVVIDALVKIALYCQGEARHDLNTLLTSGYDVVSTNRTSGPLDTPGISSINNSVSGQLTVRGQAVLNGRLYHVQMSKDGGTTWIDMGNFNGAQRMLLKPVTPGITYTVHFSALGGSTGESAWSNPVSCMAT